MPQTLTTRELAIRFGVSPDTVRRHAAAGELPAIRLGRRGHYRFVADEVEDLLERARGGGTASAAVEPAEPRSASSGEGPNWSGSAPPLGDPVRAGR